VRGGLLASNRQYLDVRHQKPDHGHPPGVTFHHTHGSTWRNSRTSNPKRVCER
jgi:hypothetical protein